MINSIRHTHRYKPLQIRHQTVHTLNVFCLYCFAKNICGPCLTEHHWPTFSVEFMIFVCFTSNLDCPYQDLWWGNDQPRLWQCRRQSSSLHRFLSAHKRKKPLREPQLGKLRMPYGNIHTKMVFIDFRCTQHGLPFSQLVETSLCATWTKCTCVASGMRLTVWFSFNRMAYHQKRITASNFDLVLAEVQRNSYLPSLFKTLLGQYNLTQGSHVSGGH